MKLNVVRNIYFCSTYQIIFLFLIYFRENKMFLINFRRREVFLKDLFDLILWIKLISPPSYYLFKRMKLWYLERIKVQVQFFKFSSYRNKFYQYDIIFLHQRTSYALSETQMCHSLYPVWVKVFIEQKYLYYFLQKNTRFLSSKCFLIQFKIN